MKTVLSNQYIIYLIIILTVFSKHVHAQKIEHFTIDKMTAKEMMPGITLRTASGKNGTFGYFEMKKGVTVPMHSHVNEQYSFILKGSVRATIGDTVFVINEGEMVLIPPNVPHSFTSLQNNTIDLDFFAPRREDWINGTADYFKNQ